MDIKGKGFYILFPSFLTVSYTKTIQYKQKQYLFFRPPTDLFLNKGVGDKCLPLSHI